MAKNKNQRTSHRVQAADGLFPRLAVRKQHMIALALIFVSLLIFFREPLFEGKVFLSADNVASHSYDTYMQDARQSGQFPLWNPYIFCGMPSYASLTVTGNRWYDLSSWVLLKVTVLVGTISGNPGVGNVLLYYIIFAVGMYWFAYSKFQSVPTATIVSMAALYSTYIIIWIMAGHNTKIFAMAMFPYALLLVERIRTDFALRWVALLILILHFNFTPTHVQMTFYTLFALGLYALFFAVRGLITKEPWWPAARAGLVVLASFGVAFLMDADRYLSTLEYNPHSIRGANPITETVNQGAPTKSIEGGLEYDYATNWSLPPEEILTFIVPSLYGFGSTTYNGVLSGNREIKVNTYFGAQPFTEAPQYMGVIVLALAIVGVVRHRRNPFVQYMALTIVTSMLIAFGREFPPIYDLMYNYFPAFNKFRVPSMILVLVQIMVPILAGYGLSSLFEQRNQSLAPQVQKRWRVGLGVLAALFVLSLVMPSITVSVYDAIVGRTETISYFSQRYGNAQVGEELYRFVTGLVINDLRLTLVLLLASGGILYLMIRRRLTLTVAAVVLLLLVTGDLWRVAAKPMEPQEQQELGAQFTPPDYVQFLQQDQSPFRILEFVDGQPPTSNIYAYWRIQSAYGYHGAKLRAYQDVIDVVGLRNTLLWELMNVKYIVSDRPDSSAGLRLVYRGRERFVYLFEPGQRRAFFVDTAFGASGLDILTDIRNHAFQATERAYIMGDLPLNIDRPSADARAEVSASDMQSMTLSVTATGNNLLFVSETYYPEGWIARLDGNDIPIYRANYMFRAVLVPPGTHTLEFTFEPKGFAVGRMLSLGANSAVVGCLLVLGTLALRKRRPSHREPEEMNERSPA